MIKGREKNMRQMLLELGVSQWLADMAIPFMMYMPGTIDPDSPSIIEIIKALQRGYRRLGYKLVKVNGILDRPTAQAMEQISGRAWIEKTWVQLAGDVIEAVANPDRAVHRMNYNTPASLNGYFEYDGPPVGPLPGIMVGTPPGPLGATWWSDDEVSDSGVKLTFGAGIKNSSVLVPIPKNSGPTYEAFKNLQRQINRLLSKVEGRISEDGLIGPGTLKGLKTVQEKLLFVNLPGDANTGSMASNAISLGAILKGEADSRGISPNANKGVTSTPASVAEAPGPALTAGQAAKFATGQITDTIKTYLPFLLLAGGVAVFAAMKKKGRS